MENLKKANYENWFLFANLSVCQFFFLQLSYISWYFDSWLPSSSLQQNLINLKGVPLLDSI